MRNSVLSSVFMIALAAFSLFTSCEKDSDLTTSVVDVENYVDSTMYEIQRDANCGRFGCYELVFPITLNFPDSTSVEVESYEDLRETVRAWKEANPGVCERPKIAFPIEVMTDNGDIISIDNPRELLELRRRCRRSFFANNGPRGHQNRPMFCFKPVFPLALEFPDGTVEEADDRRDLKQLIRRWKADNWDSEERPSLVFPIEVELEDGTTATVNSPEELAELKEECSEGA